MNALVLERGALSRRDVAVPRRDRECLIRVRMAGICGTDLQLLDGYAAFAGIPGHEFVGVVERAPAGEAYWIGRRVVGEINVGCGACELCATGVKEHCTSRSVVGIRERDGAFAEYLSLPAANLHEVPEHMGDETAVFVEPVAAACRIFEQLRIEPQARIAVLGDGRMGLLVAQVLATATSGVVLIGRHESKLAIGRSLGLSAVRADEVERAPRFDVVVDVTGRPEGLHDALALVRPRGTVVMKSTFHGEAAIESWPIVVNEVALIGSRCGPFDRGLQMLSSHAISVKPLISNIAALSDYAAAFDEARRSVKVLFDLSL